MPFQNPVLHYSFLIPFIGNADANPHLTEWTLVLNIGDCDLASNNSGDKLYEKNIYL